MDAVAEREGLMRRPVIMLAALLGVVGGLAATPAGAARDQSVGIFRNPKNSVHIRIHPCGQSMCGTVVWANEKAQRDAREGGTPRLVGTELFKGFKRIDAKRWKGRVFVPDINKTFSGTVTVEDQNTLTGRGCLFAGIGCKSQSWTRVD